MPLWSSELPDWHMDPWLMSHHVDMSNFFGGQKKEYLGRQLPCTLYSTATICESLDQVDLFEQTVYGYTGENRWPRLYWREQMAQVILARTGGLGYAGENRWPRLQSAPATKGESGCRLPVADDRSRQVPKGNSGRRIIPTRQIISRTALATRGESTVAYQSLIDNSRRGREEVPPSRAGPATQDKTRL
jgi:hypothetical protein